MSNFFEEAAKRYEEASMVLDAAMAGTFVSLMMNGVCCMWQQHEDQEMREAIRRDMRTEYWNHRLMEHELEMHLNNEHLFDPNDENANGKQPKNLPSLSQEDRRKRLMLNKLQAAAAGAAASHSPETRRDNEASSRHDRVADVPHIPTFDSDMGSTSAKRTTMKSTSLADDEYDSEDEGSFTEISLK